MRPEKGTYPHYYTNYLPLVKEDELIPALEINREQMITFFRGVPKSKEQFSYAPGKWNIRQVLQHLNDTERILGYRALRFARQDPQQPLPFDENKYALSLDLSKRDLVSLIEEFETVRQASISLFKNFDEEMLMRSGKTAAGEATVISIGYMICGHAIHHMNVVRERYLGK
jgi:hypothetical protein